MPNRRRRIARKPGTNRHFLISQTDSRRVEEISEGGAESRLRTLLAAFPERGHGQRLRQEATERLNPCRRFSVLALRPDEVAEGAEAEASIDGEDPWVSIAAHVDRFCQRTGAFWGLGDTGCLVVYVPDRDGSECLELVRRLQDDIRTCTGRTATAAVATYPTLDYSRQETPANASKALDHAAFFGPNSRVLFDAVSLNISGDKYYERGDIPAAMREFEHALAMDDSNVNVHNSLGVCHAVLGDHEKALEQFSTALGLDSNEYMAIYNIGLIHALRGRRDTALGFFLRSNEMRPDVYEILFQTGRLYLEMNQPQAARPYLEHASRVRGKSGSVYRLLGDCYTSVGWTEKAISAYKKAVKANPGDAMALSALGGLFDEKGENPEIALVFCRESVRLAPDNALFRRRLGALLVKMNQFEEALEQFEEAGRLGADASEEIRQVREQMAGGLTDRGCEAQGAG
jgi:tetratricopeptide (TPR) repeat protein